MRKPLALLLLIAPQVAHASLGGGVDSITTDQARMPVRMHAVARAGAGNRHTLSLNNGGEVREYTNAAGTVYAIRWTGPGKPDLESLMGAHYATMQADNPARARRGMRRAPGVNRADLRVVTGGRTGSFWGYAWLPQQAPAGFDPATL